MMDGKTLTNSELVDGGWACGLGATLVPTTGSAGAGLSFVASFMAKIHDMKIAVSNVVLIESSRF
jgi:hypothetical protein